jgi:hypothetical protein
MWQFEITRDDGRLHFLSFKEVEDPYTVDEEQLQVGAKTTVSETDAVCLLQERDKRVPVEDAYSALLEVDCLHSRTVNRKRIDGLWEPIGLLK